MHGLVRRVALEDSSHRLGRIASILNRVTLHSGSMESFPSLYQVVRRVEPDECYHLAAQSFVTYSFEDAFSILNVNVNGTHYMLESLRHNAPRCRFYFAGSSEMFGKAEEVPQTERTRFYPRSAYGISKVAGFHLTRNYREAYHMHTSTGILFNHESERRGHEFVTRKITAGVAAIAAGKQKELRLGNLDAQRDWGYAPDYVETMWRMLQQDQGDDYVVASGVVHSVREFAQVAFSLVGLNYQDFVVIDPQLYRPSEAHILVGNAEKFQKCVGWRPKTSFQKLIRLMVEADLLAAGVTAKLQ